MWPISHYVFCFHLHLCIFPGLGPPVLEQLEAGGIFRSPSQNALTLGIVWSGCWPWESSSFL